jgi:hypothetical protein
MDGWLMQQFQLAQVILLGSGKDAMQHGELAEQHCDFFHRASLKLHLSTTDTMHSPSC